MCSRNDDPWTIEDAVMEAGRLAGEYGEDIPADRPTHTHRDDRDATDDCPACAWDIDHLGGAS